MDHRFRSSRFDKLLIECGRLVAAAADHERALGELLERLQVADPESLRADSAAPVDVPASETFKGVGPGVPHDLLDTVRRLRAAAGQQRQRAEALHSGLIGEPAASGHFKSGRPIVLVVDDSKDSVETVALFLELSGFHVITASNGLEALVAAHYARPEVAVMDVAMPVLNGLEAARLLKASPVTRHTKLMAYTANWSTSDSALKEVFAEVLAKPASADTFLSTVQQLAAADNTSIN